MDATTIRSWMVARPTDAKPKRHLQIWAAVSRSTQELSACLLPVVRTAGNAVGPPESWPRMQSAGAHLLVAQVPASMYPPWGLVLDSRFVGKGVVGGTWLVAFLFGNGKAPRGFLPVPDSCLSSILYLSPRDALSLRTEQWLTANLCTQLVVVPGCANARTSVESIPMLAGAAGRFTQA